MAGTYIYRYIVRRSDTVSFMSKKDAYSQAGRTAVLQNIQGTLQFLQRFPPFNQMEHSHLAYLVEQCQLRFYASGESIVKPADGPVEHFYIVKQGRVVGERQHLVKPGVETTFEITSGECFPLAALLGERATRTEHLAGEDTFCLQLNKAAFIRVFSMSEVFRDFALRGVSSLLDQVNQQVRQRAVETLGTQYSLNQDPNTIQGAYSITNLSFGAADRQGRWKASLFVNNLFDKRYAAGLNSSIANGTWSPKAPNVALAVNTTEWLPPRDYHRYFGVRADLSF